VVAAGRKGHDQISEGKKGHDEDKKKGRVTLSASNDFHFKATVRVSEMYAHSPSLLYITRTVAVGSNAFCVAAPKHIPTTAQNATKK